MFEMTYEAESWTGTYSIEDITYTADGKEYSLNFKKMWNRRKIRSQSDL